MLRRVLFALLLTSAVVSAQAPTPAPPAVDVPASAVRGFIDALPRDVVSDRSIRTVDVGGYRVGVYGVFRPKAARGTAQLHRVRTSEIYYMLKGAGTLVTGGTMVDPQESKTSPTNVSGSGIKGGVSRRLTPGDIVVIPGNTPHWWSELEGDIEYLIFRPDPDNRLALK